MAIFKMRAYILKYLKNIGPLRFRSKEHAHLSGSPGLVICICIYTVQCTDRTPLRPGG